MVGQVGKDHGKRIEDQAISRVSSGLVSDSHDTLRLVTVEHYSTTEYVIRNRAWRSVADVWITIRTRTAFRARCNQSARLRQNCSAERRPNVWGPHHMIETYLCDISTMNSNKNIVNGCNWTSWTVVYPLEWLPKKSLLRTELWACNDLRVVRRI